MIKIKRIDHVAIAVGDRDAAGARLLGLFGLVEEAREHVKDQRADVLFLGCGQGRTPVPGADLPTSIELVAPAAATGQEPTNAGLQRFLDKRGPGLHHVCFEVEDLEEALARPQGGGSAADRRRCHAPVQRGHRVAFLHPAATGGVLFELCAAGHTS